MFAPSPPKANSSRLGRPAAESSHEPTHGRALTAEGELFPMGPLWGIHGSPSGVTSWSRR